MKYFTPEEFHGHYERLDPELKEMLDNFREQWGDVVNISPHPDAVGRTDGNGFHNYKKHGSVKAVDVLPAGFYGPAAFKRGFAAAVSSGARGIGIYPDWRPQPGMHIDVGQRKGRSVDYVAKWSAFRIDGQQRYFNISRALRNNNE